MAVQANVRELIAEIVNRIVAEYRPRKVVLFGSQAYGEPREDSDIDLLIIKDTSDSQADRWAAVKRLLRDLTPNVAVTPLVYTQEEVDRRMALKDFFLTEILERGEVLYG